MTTLTTEERSDLYQQCFPLGVLSLKPFPLMTLLDLKDYYFEFRSEFRVPHIQRQTRAADHCFVLKVSNDDMSPMFPTGTVLVVDPLLKPKSEDFVLAYIHHQRRVLLRQYHQECGSAELSALNEAISSVLTMSFEDRIVGVVVESEIRFD